MHKIGWVLALALVSACSSHDDAAKFAGSWAYASGSVGTITCGSQSFPFPLDGVTEMFTISDSALVKADSQGCAGIKFDVVGNVATLAGDGQSCMIPAAGMNPAATFAPHTYTFTMSADETTLVQALTASYTPQGGMSCSASVSANTLSRK